MTLRPQPLMTVFSLAALALLVWLGLWQLQRREWKQDLIARYEATAEADAVTLYAALCGGGDLRRRPVTPPETQSTPFIRMYGFSANGEPGWRILRMAEAPACETEAAGVLVQTGFERLTDSVLEPVEQLRLAPMPEPGPFSAENAPGRNEWHRFDRAALAEAFGLAPDGLMPVWGRADAPPLSATEVPPARHLGYALTWFGLALTLIGVYIAWHVRERRFRWR